MRETDRGREWLSRAMAIDSDDDVSLYNVACAYFTVGDLDAAFDLFERVLPQATDWIKSWIKYDSDLNPLRQPRYQKLRKLIESP